MQDVVDQISPFVGIAGLAGTALSLIIAWRGLPKKSLHFSLGPLTDLGLSEQVTVSYNGSPLEDPHTVAVNLESDGRQSVKSEDFDRGAPMVMHFGAATVLELLRTYSVPKGYSPPPALVEDNALKIGPGAIGRKRTVSYVVMVEGRPTLSCDAPLADVTVEAEEHKRVRRLTGWLNRNRRGVWLLFWVSIASLYYYFFFVFLGRSDRLDPYMLVSPRAGEGSWVLQVPVEQLPTLPGDLDDECSASLQRAAAAGAGVAADSLTVILDVFTSGSNDEVAFLDARVILDERRPLIEGDLVKCDEQQVELEWARGSDGLMVNLDRQTVSFVPARTEVDSPYDYTLSIQATAGNCYCRWHLEVDLDLNGTVHTLLIDGSGRVREIEDSEKPEIIPLELVGGAKAQGYSHVDGQWRSDG